MHAHVPGPADETLIGCERTHVILVATSETIKNLYLLVCFCGIIIVN